MFATDQMAADIGTVVYGDEAVRLGLINSLGGLKDALSYLHGRDKKEQSEKLILHSGTYLKSVI